MKNKNPTALGNLREDLRQAANPQKAKILQRFFKTGPGEYAEGDIFLGVAVPQTRAIIKKYWREISIKEAEILLHDKIHEERLAALLILVEKFEKGDEPSRKEIFNLYLANAKFVNNWDLVDLSAPKIVGAYLEDKDKNILLDLAESKNLWERRIAMLATFRFIKNGDAAMALKIAEILINEKEDLIHKAVGWMLREIGKNCGQKIEEDFLRRHYRIMSRTTLRYAIERFDEDTRQTYLTGRI
ncbi:MAG TPA: DNA alkylation repair protein [Candidatus Pacearchaeota archaeon]|jgi:3-methyladenine DNA glycosylase AlkD|nr:MAG: DNA alkylation repair protein [Candidatus Yanofskybacteria bacterium]HNR81355.1 DNA alkylation repair protein [Candidatus Pacearchaeota archaeon]HPO06582.1 DNA alkylation repair protein [Candidatus Pacearchaeota archaeon]